VNFSLAYVGYDVLEPFVAYGVEAGLRYSAPEEVEARLAAVVASFRAELPQAAARAVVPFNRKGEWGRGWPHRAGCASLFPFHPPDAASGSWVTLMTGWHHPARLGLGAPQDATGAERCAVSVGPVDRMFATPPDSPGQCEPGLSDDRPRDPRLCYCPELSPRATRSSSS